MTDHPREEGGEPPLDVDSEFAKIVARFGNAPDASVLDDLFNDDDDLLDEPVPPIELEHLAHGDTGHFVPPDPGPLTLPEPRRMLAWIAMLGGPLVMLFLLIFGFYTPPWVGLLLTLAFVGGFVTLVATMPPREDDDPWDSSGGAVL